MSYFPLLQVPGCKGYTTICNFSPNSWEYLKKRKRFINLTWASDQGWVTKNLGTLPFNAFKTVTTDDVKNIVPQVTLSLISVSDTIPPVISKYLPKLLVPKTVMPAWRASIGLCSSISRTSYQGEIDAFNASGSLLSFAPFIQYGKNIENFLILLNIEDQSEFRYADLKISDAEGNRKGQYKIRNNAANLIPLDGLNLHPESLPVMHCKEMAGIPLYFSRTKNGDFLSLEHTHPPSSLVILGKRWEVQKNLKNTWFKKVNT